MLDDDNLDIISIKEVKTRIFDIFNNIKALGVGSNILPNKIDDERWDFLKNEFYTEIKTLVLFELEHSNRFPDMEAK